MNKVIVTVCAVAGAAGLAAALSLGGLSSARAQQPATMPSTAPSVETAVAQPSFSFGGGGGGGGFGYGGFGRSPRDWDDMMNFFSQYAPNRARVLSDLSLDKDPENGLRRKLLGKWHVYNDLKRRFPEMASLYVKRTKIEDSLFELTIEARRFPGNRAAIYTEMHEKVAALVDLSIQERKLRIDHMQKLITEEQMKMSHDQDHRDDVIEERMTHLLDRIKPSANDRSEIPHPDDSTALADADLMSSFNP